MDSKLGKNIQNPYYFLLSWLLCQKKCVYLPRYIGIN